MSLESQVLKAFASLLALSPVPLVLGTKDPGRPEYRDAQSPELQEAFQPPFLRSQ